MSLGGLIGNFFGGSSSGNATDSRVDYPYMSASKLYKWSRDYMDKYPYDPAAPYTGKLSAEMTPTEQKAQTQLSSYMDTPTSSSLTAANKYNTAVLQGEYDPRTSPYYAAMKKQILKDAEEAGASVRHGAATTGTLHSDPRHVQERKLTENVSDQLATLLGNLYESERGRMTTAASQAPQIATAEAQIPLTKITAGTTLGSIPREVTQDDLNRQYAEYQRQVQGASVPYSTLNSLAGLSYSPYPQSYNSTDTGANMSGLIQAALPYIMNMFSGSNTGSATTGTTASGTPAYSLSTPSYYNDNSLTSLTSSPLYQNYAGLS